MITQGRLFHNELVFATHGEEFHQCCFVNVRFVFHPNDIFAITNCIVCKTLDDIPPYFEKELARYGHTR